MNTEIIRRSEALAPWLTEIRRSIHRFPETGWLEMRTSALIASELTRLGYRVLQLNAVVASNTHARHLYERLGFVQLGTIPGGFRRKDGHYEDICPYYHVL